MNKLMLSLKTSLVMFGLTLLLTTPSLQAEDIEIYGIADANNPPVNIMFIFDMSGSMNDEVGSTGRSQREVLLDALTNVLERNKEKSNLRVGFTWFNTWRAGISFPATSISADLNIADPLNVPSGSHFVYDQIPKQLGRIGANGLTNIVGSLYETAKYYRGETVSGWKGYEPPAWKTWSGGFYHKSSSPHWLSYTPDNGTNAWTREGTYKTDNLCTERLDLPDSNWYACRDGLDKYYHRLNVRNCRTVEGVYLGCAVSDEDRCTTVGETTTCDPCAEEDKIYDDVRKCDHDKWVQEWLGATYNSPIEESCQPSYIVLLSDGKPTKLYDVWSIENEIIHAQCAEMPALPDGKCGPELVKYLADNDQIPGLAGSKVHTYTIGFNVQGEGRDYLELLAEKGNGIFYPASNATDLEDTFNLIIESITGENETFTGLVTTIKASTLSSDNRVFMNMFQPGDTKSWKGNTKGYFISPDGLLDLNGNQAVVSIDGAEKFSDSAQSFWSDSADSNHVEQGGASDKLHASSRKILFFNDAAAPSSSSLTELETGDNTIPFSLFGVVDEAEKDELIDWLNDEAKMADPLHAKPVLLDYGSRKVLYTMTNQGLLHAIDATQPLMSADGTIDNTPPGGNELYAFLPRALMSQIKDQKANLNQSGHLYGLDGPISFYHNDDKAGENTTDGDHIINNGEEAYLYFGMRRGGKNYYALDISDPTSPKLEWRIEGGAGGTAGFEKLAQTWSRMTPTTVKWGGALKKVLIFGGGYDVDQDNYASRTHDDTGNVVFMVDAVTGAKLWKGVKNGSPGSGNKSNYSIPGDITVIDSDSDRVADRLYFGDMGGQVWRVDLVDNDNNVEIKGFRLAKLGGNDAENSRRFFSPPAVARIKGSSGFFFAVTIGSGFRAHPLNIDTKDRMYMVQDFDVSLGHSTDTNALEEDDLYDITNDVTTATAGIAAKRGWRLTLEQDPGEKNLTPGLIFDHKLAFTTFAPANTGNNICGGGGGGGRFYLIDLENGAPVKNFYDENSSDSLTAENRFKTVPGLGIPTEPVLYFPPGIGTADLYVGKHKVDSIDNPMVRINWKVVE